MMSARDSKRVNNLSLSVIRIVVLVRSGTEAKGAPHLALWDGLFESEVFIQKKKERQS
jgi:hypothetical protein